MYQLENKECQPTSHEIWDLYVLNKIGLKYMRISSQYSYRKSSWCDIFKLEKRLTYSSKCQVNVKIFGYESGSNLLLAWHYPVLPHDSPRHVPQLRSINHSSFYKCWAHCSHFLCINLVAAPYHPWKLALARYTCVLVCVHVRVCLCVFWELVTC